jgi:3-hydroxyacyl-CoA dehydrogenase
MASYEVVNGVAVITCQNLPVNQLSYNLRVGLFDGLEKATADPKVRAIVIAADGKTFPAGADIKEFSTGMGFKKPITEFIPKCEACEKPVVASIHGTALGGGLEVALGCHYRIGSSRCKVGFPEVLIGLLPGAGGTQRLPRLIGPMNAAEMIVSGQHVRADRALRMGILDRVVKVLPNHGKSMERLIMRQAAIRFALEIADEPVAPRRISGMTAFDMNDFFYDFIRQGLKKKARGFMAPELNLQSVMASHREKDFAAGMKKERQLFSKLISGKQAPALQHLFFAQRQISKVPGVNPALARDLQSVGVVGCGTMGGGIVMCFVEKGIPVVVLETKQDYLDRGLSVVQGNWARQVKRGKITKKTLEKYMSLITPTLNYADFRDVDIVIEAVFENTEVKRTVFTALDKNTKPSCILASNTSFLDIGDIAKVTSRPHKVVGCHFFAPANQMQLLENVRHASTDEETIATVQKMAVRIGKKGVLARVCPGFIGNRMFAVEGHEVRRLLMAGASPVDIDKAMYDFGWAMGPVVVTDLSGLDIGYRRRDEQGYISNPASRPKDYPYDLEDKLVQMGRLGMKTKKGFYDYPKGRTPVPSKLVEKMLADEWAKRGVSAKTFDPKDIVACLMYPMVNEGFKILEEDVAIRPSDIDVTFVFGYGFPAYEGGVMYWGDQVGLKNILEYMEKEHAKNPAIKHLEPSSLLKELVASKTTLAKYWKKKEASKKSKL